MTPSEWLVLGAGIGAISWINWYFLVAAHPAVTAANRQGVQEARIVVQGGYQPADVQVRAGEPVRLLFDRRETSSCSEEVLVVDFGVKRFLAPHATTAVEFTPTTPGTFEFTCGMGMLRGRISVVAQEGR